MSSAEEGIAQEAAELRDIPVDREAPTDELFSRLQAEGYEALDRVNIVVVGNAGVGKSTLINALFREPVAETGVGSPVTQTIRVHEPPDLPLRIYDTPGLELEGSADQLINDIGSLVERSRETPSALLHVCWFCLNGRQARFQSEERQAVIGLADLLDVILVATQVVDEGDAELYLPLVEHVDADRLPVVGRRVLPTLAKTVHLGTSVVPAHGLDELVSVTLDALPDAARRAFLNSLRATEGALELKTREAHRVVAAASAAAALVGAAPVPFADAAVLVPIQIGMMAGVNAVMGVDLSDDEIDELLKEALAAGVTTYFGKWLVAQVTKFVPGVGSAINAAVAAGLTAALGEAYIRMCQEILKARAEGRPLPMKQAAEILNSQFGPLLRERFSGKR